MKKSLVFGAIAAVGLVASSAASFAGGSPCCVTPPVVNPWYVGIGINYSANQTDKVSPRAAGEIGYKLKDQGLGGNLFVGYQVNRYFGAELGGSVLGDDKYRETGNVAPNVNGKLKVTNQWNVHFYGTAQLPVTAWFAPYAFAGVGYFNSQVKTDKYWNQTSTFGTNSRTTNSQFSLMYGAGLNFNFNQFGVRVNYTFTNGSHSTVNVSNSNVAPKDYISLDVLYRFGS